jgi:hypothetical protein
MVIAVSKSGIAPITILLWRGLGFNSARDAVECVYRKNKTYTDS